MIRYRFPCPLEFSRKQRMADQAFHLNRQFVADLQERINSFNSTFMPLAGFDSDVPQGKIPSQEQLAFLLDAAFWASYEKEEGKSLSVSLVFSEPEHAPHNFCFDRPIPLNPKSLIKLAPAIENPRAHIIVWPDERNRMQIWGFRTGSEDFIIADLWIQGIGPGCILVTYGGRSLAALTGSKAVFVDPGILMKAILPKISPRDTSDNPHMVAMMRYNSLLFLGRAMRSHGHGGTILVVPEDSNWRHSIRHPVPYTGGASFLDSPFENLQPAAAEMTTRKSLVDFIKKRFTKGQNRFTGVREKFRQQCNRIARLTAVDGALVMTQDRYTYCFGAKIQAKAPAPPAVELQALQPIEGWTGSSLNFSDLGGTRHQSAAQFAYDQPQAVAITASQDGDVTFFTQESMSGRLLVIQQAELALLHEGLSGALWNISLFSTLDLEKK